MREHYDAATLFFLLCLTVREDAGMHIFAFLFVLVAMDWLRSIPLTAEHKTDMIKI